MNVADLPQLDIAGLSVRPARYALNLLEKILLAGLLLLLMGVAVTLLLTATIINTQHANKMTGLQNRAAICVSITAQIGEEHLPLLCTSADVRKYYDPNQIPYQGVHDHALLCQFLSRVGSIPPECSDLGTSMDSGG